MPAVNLGGLGYGDRVQHELRVVERTERTKANGEPYIILTLGNASGQIETEPIWLNRLDDGWADGAERGAVVQAVGDIARYDAHGATKRQLRLSAPLRLIPRDSLAIDDFLPRIADDPVRLWESLDRFRREITSVRLQRVLELFFGDEPFRLCFERVPASIRGHHSRVGGLLLHVFEVTHIARQTARAMRADIDLVTAGALLHDIGKTEAYAITWEGFARTPCGYLIEHVVLGCQMLERRLASLGEPLCSPDQLLELQHIVLSHHGSLEFGSPVRPLTTEAEIVHRADEASAKSADVAECLADEEAFREGASFADRKRLWRVEGRHLWRRAHRWD